MKFVSEIVQNGGLTMLTCRFEACLSPVLLRSCSLLRYLGSHANHPPLQSTFGK